MSNMVVYEPDLSQNLDLPVSIFEHSSGNYKVNYEFRLHVVQFV